MGGVGVCTCACGGEDITGSNPHTIVLTPHDSPMITVGVVRFVGVWFGEVCCGDDCGDCC
jgi:hypothetical protein